VSEAITRGFRIEVESIYVPERSRPEDDYYFFAYHVTMTNLSRLRLQLQSRRWVITDANGHVETVEGPGVVGETPIFEPNGSYEYTSFCPLRTDTGTMHGSYRLVDLDSGEEFDAVIARFELAFPHVVN
jgi:ApaG protein